MGKERKKVLVVGSSGMLGSDLMSLFSLKPDVEAVPLSRRELDIRERSSTRAVISAIRPAVVILAAAYTKVDDCEANKELAFDINSEGAGNVAAGCADAGAKLVYISTDYIFSGKKGSRYLEADAPAPLNVYGQSKLFGEERVRDVSIEHCIIRTSWLFGTNGPNFVKSILAASRKRSELRVVDDQEGSPTYTLDLASAIYTLMQKNITGTVHVSNRGSCTWNDFAKEIIRNYKVGGVKVSPVKTSEFARPARRPARSVLDCSRFEELTGERMRTWQEALEAYVAEEER